MATFLTGATGFLGGHLLRAMLERGERVVALVRAADGDEARAKLVRALAGAGAAPAVATRLDGVCIRRGDLAKPGLGLDGRSRDAVRSECDQILHCGAAVRFNESLAEARAVNLGGTRAVLELALECPGRIRRFDYVSTAFVAGNRTDRVAEADLDARDGHKNPYERSKYEAETAVRAAAAKLPVTIHRPSIIVGDSTSGETAAFRTLYGLLRIYARGLWRTCPANPRLRPDLVPVDFVRDAMMAIRRSEDTLGRCFHLAAGPERSMSIGELAEIVHAAFPHRRPVRFVSPELWSRVAHPVLRHVRVGRWAPVVREGQLYLPYLARMPEFDVSNTSEVVRRFGVRIPHVRDYIARILDFCVATDFGRRRPAGPESSADRSDGRGTPGGGPRGASRA